MRPPCMPFLYDSLSGRLVVILAQSVVVVVVVVVWWARDTTVDSFIVYTGYRALLNDTQLDRVHRAHLNGLQLDGSIPPRVPCNELSVGTFATWISGRDRKSAVAAKAIGNS